MSRFFIDGMGGEVEYYIFRRNKFFVGVQLLVGWGFMNYDVKSNNFEGGQQNHILIEPTVNMEHKIGYNHGIGLGIGYRPLLRDGKITYTSNLSNGEIPLRRQFPNGLTLILTLKGFL
jgi:hypothetical protein